VRVGKLVKPGTDAALPGRYSEPHSKTHRDKATDAHTDLLFPELDG
jgi:DNA polymerase-4